MLLRLLLSLALLAPLAPAIAQTAPAATTTPAVDAANPALKLLPASSKWRKARHGAILRLNKEIQPQLIFIGDSITHQFGGTKTPGGDGCRDYGIASWNKYYAPRKAVNMGFSGDQTGHVLWRLKNGELDGIAPKVAVLMIGTNNARAHTPEQVAGAIGAIIETIHEKSPQTQVLLLGVFPRHHKNEAPALIAFPGKLNALLQAKYGTGTGGVVFSTSAAHYPTTPAPPTKNFSTTACTPTPPATRPGPKRLSRHWRS